MKNETIIKFKIKNSDIELTIATETPELIFGVTFLIVSPEYQFLEKITLPEFQSKIKEYQNDLSKDVTGVFTGSYAINPINNEEIPVYLCDYIISNTRMGIPAHNELDYEFAKKNDIPIKQVLVPLYLDIANPPKEGVPTVKRKNINIIIKHWNEPKYLILRWHVQDWVTLVIGGVEDGEDFEIAAIREINEETGYQNIKINEINPFYFICKYYAEHKNVNREANMYVAYGELIDDKKVEISEEEKKLAEPAWVSKEEMLLSVNKPPTKLIEWFAQGSKPYIGDGILTNSAFLNDMNVEEARNKIKEKLEEIGEIHV